MSEIGVVFVIVSGIGLAEAPSACDPSPKAACGVKLLKYSEFFPQPG